MNDLSQRDDANRLPWILRSFWWEPLTYLGCMTVWAILSVMEYGLDLRQWITQGDAQVVLLLAGLFYVSDLRYRLCFRTSGAGLDRT